MALYLEQISANRYAPQGSDPVYLYANGLEGGQHLTLAQLVIAVSMRSAAAYEAQSVVKMNRMAGGADQLEKVAEFMELIANGDGDWPTIKAYCQSELGITETLPDANRHADAREPPRRGVLGVIQHCTRARHVAGRQRGELLGERS